MVKRIKAYDPVTIICIIIGIVGIAAGFFNWKSDAEFSMSFPKNQTDPKVSSYYNVRPNQMIVAQHTGNSSCKYSISTKKRGQSNYKDVPGGMNLTFSQNDVGCSPLDIKSSGVFDICVKVKKSAENSTASELLITLGKSE